MNKSGQLLEVAQGALAENKIRAAFTTPPPQELWNASDRAIALMDRILGLTAARQGETKSHDSAIMFSDQVAQAEIKMFLLNTGLTEVLDQLGDSYFFAAKDMYVGDERKILNPKSGKVIRLNFPEIVDGQPVLYNEIATLPRYVVRVEQAKHGLTVRKRYLSLYTELLKQVRNPLLAATYELEQVRYLGLPESQMAEMEDDCAVFRAFNKKQMLVQISDMDLKLAQNEQAIKQIQNPPPAPAPTGLPSLGSPMQTAPPDNGGGMGAVAGAAGLAGGMNAQPQG
jgi:hypothetical protein